MIEESDYLTTNAEDFSFEGGDITIDFHVMSNGSGYLIRSESSRRGVLSVWIKPPLYKRIRGIYLIEEH